MECNLVGLRCLKVVSSLCVVHVCGVIDKKK